MSNDGVLGILISIEGCSHTLSVSFELLVIQLHHCRPGLVNPRVVVLFLKSSASPFTAGIRDSTPTRQSRELVMKLPPRRIQWHVLGTKRLEY